MASCNDRGGSAAGGSSSSMTASTRRARSLDQTAHVTSGCIGIPHPGRSLGGGVFIFGGEGFEHAALEDLNLLLRVLQRSLAVLQQLGATLVRGERIGQRQLAVLHGRQDRLELCERSFKGLGSRVGLGHRQGGGTRAAPASAGCGSNLLKSESKYSICSLPVNVGAWTGEWFAVIMPPVFDDAAFTRAFPWRADLAKFEGRGFSPLIVGLVT